MAETVRQPPAGGPLRAEAHAKVNLTLHVTGRRENGYHELDSLVVFAGIADTLTARPAADLTLTVSGPFSDGVPTDDGNLVLKAAVALRKTHGVTQGAALALEKALPHAAGLGSGSADAAAALALLARLWDVPAPSPADPLVSALGADVPVCLAGPRPQRMAGIGEVLTPVPDLPSAALVLVNPGDSVPTARAFAGLKGRHHPSMGTIPAGLDLDTFADWLAHQRNDLAEPATAIAPGIGEALGLLRRQPFVRWAGMSGSGATCIGLVRDMDEARRAARAIQVAQMGWWVAPAPLLSGVS